MASQTALVLHRRILAAKRRTVIQTSSPGPVRRGGVRIRLSAELGWWTRCPSADLASRALALFTIIIINQRLIIPESYITKYEQKSFEPTNPESIILGTGPEKALEP